MPVSNNGIDNQSISNNGIQKKQALSTANDTVSAGVYDATTLSAVDTDLASANIKATTTIFGKAGATNVVDTTTGDAANTDIMNGKVAWVDGSEVTGNLATVALADDSTDYPAGYHAGETNLMVVDADLVTGNIKSGQTIFNVAGHTNVRDSSDADAAVGEVKTGSTFYAGGGVKKTGSGTQTLNPANENVTAGYYAGTTLSAVDVHLAVGNIKDGVEIFGFTGTVVEGGAETIEAVSNAVLAGSATYTPGVSGIFAMATINGQIGVQYYSTGSATWYSPYAGATTKKGLTAIGDGANFRIRSGAAGQEYYLFRHYIATGTYERATDVDQGAGTAYTPSSGFIAQAGESSDVELHAQYGTAGWDNWRESADAFNPVTIAIGDGTNLRVNNKSGIDQWMVVMRAVMT